MYESFPNWPFVIVGVAIFISLILAIVQIVKKTPYEQGQVASRDGMLITDNPYQLDSEYKEFKDWEEGFVEDALHDV